MVGGQRVKKIVSGAPAAASTGAITLSLALMLVSGGSGGGTIWGCAAGLANVACAMAAEVDQPLKVEAPPASMKLDPFYKKYVSADGYPILSSGDVSDYALLEAAYLVKLMLAKRPDVKEAMVRGGSRMTVIGYREFTTDIPEHRDFKPKDFWDRRARGTGGSPTDPVCTCAEENVLGYEGDPYSTECILIHEFAHSIHLRGMLVVDPTFDTRLKETYADAMKKGLWKDKYASTNPAEYFAEGVQSWFDNNRPPDHDHNHVRTRKLLKEYDPGLAKLCEEVFGETQLVYTKPVTRLRDHLVGYDPSKSPKFVWPERLAKIGEQIRLDTVETRRKKNAAQTASPKDEDGYELRQLEGWTLHIHPQLLKEEAEATEKAVKLLTGQLQEIVRVVPAPAVDQLRKVPLWFTPGYPGVQPRAEYHPDIGWLKENKRNVAMEKSVEFSDIRDFEAETKRMPNFALHELAHAYHDRVLGFDHAGIKEAYERAVKSGTYDAVERWLGPDRPKRVEKSYAMTNEKEYFAELTESLFSRNDYFPFVREELERHDPAAVEVLKRVWGVPAGR